MLTFVPPWIPEKPLLAIVGQSPGSVEARQGRPFVGPAGEQQRAWLRAVGLDPDEDVMWTNVCSDFHSDEPNYKPTAKESREGYDRVREEIGALPSIACVLLVGGPASHMVFRGNMGQMQGRQGTIVYQKEESNGEHDLPETENKVAAVPRAGRATPSVERSNGSDRRGLHGDADSGGSSVREMSPDSDSRRGSPLTHKQLPTFACYHPSFYIRQHSFKKRAEIEGQVMDVLARVVEVIKGKAPELELPEPEYVEEVVIT